MFKPLRSLHGLALAGREEDQSARELRRALRLATGARTGRGKGSALLTIEATAVLPEGRITRVVVAVASPLCQGDAHALGANPHFSP